MSADVIGMIIALFAFALSVLGGVAGMLARQTKLIDAKLDAFAAAVDRRFERLEDRVARVEAELVEVKVAIARIEGPRPRLQQL